MNAVRVALTIAFALVAGCSSPLPREPDEAGSANLYAERWPEADRLFFHNPGTPEWKGADVANSVALGDGRVLWVFGDTLLAQPGSNRCERFDEFAIQIHNSLALQQGTDPTTARIRHFWGRQADQPESFFHPTAGSDGWYWMGGVTVLGRQALVFLMHARATAPVEPDSGQAPSCAGLAFEMLGWDARIATITSGDPDQWQWRSVKRPDNAYWHSILAGSSTVTVQDDYLYAWSSGPAAFGGNPVYLARWPLAAARSGDLHDPQWYTGSGWQTQSTLGDLPPFAIVPDGNNEISVGHNLWPDDPRGWWWLQSTEIVNSTLCFRHGESPFDFGECRLLLAPPELTQYPESNLLVYAAKFQPALSSGDGAAIATYVVNSCDLEDIQEKCDLYYPRFIKLRRQQQGDSRREQQ